ncbi:MAG: GTPase HflX [Clostridia bacterium]|nr:GTPase HflX [Clostridia bacterium]
MAELHENIITPERALLVSLDTGEPDAEASLLELRELARTAGAEVVGVTVQKRPAPDAGTCVGEGKLEEIRAFCEANDIDLVIFDRELSPIQQRNIELETKVRTIDRTTLILDIFAARARSREGALQVELAQLKYSLPRLAGQGTALSRLGGGIGTRGPGETKLETDKRHIRRRIDALREQLRELQAQRDRIRARRKKDGVITVAIVGYTNAGKSTLMNTLTQAGVLAEDKLFATLDPTARALRLPHGQTVMLIDTVGLVRRLPHHLVEAFKSTLEEAAQADVILNVCDASSDEAATHLQVTQNLLAELGIGDRPVIPVMNKCDRLSDAAPIIAIGDTVRISAKRGDGLETLLLAIENKLPKWTRMELLLPFDKGGLLAAVRSQGQLLSEEYTAEGIEAVALVSDPALVAALRKYCR